MLLYIPRHLPQTLHRSFVAVFLKVGFTGHFQFIVPFFAEVGCQRSFKELIEPYVQLAAKLFGRLTDFPAVIVHGCERWVFGKTYRIECA